MAGYVVYLRVSTQKQGASGLGLEAQQAAIASYSPIIATYTEVESGRNSDRPQLKAALAECRRRKATLLIAKLDRLSRNVAFLATLLDGDVQIVAADNPNATKFTLHILAAVAEFEATQISTRTRAALAAAKARGVALGGHRANALPREACARGRAVQAAAARARAMAIEPMIARARAAGATTASAIARWLAAACVPTPTGHGAWQAIMVTRILNRVAA